MSALAPALVPQRKLMYLRPKTTRRLLILGLVLTLIFAAGATMWMVNTRKAAKRIAQARADAMAAFERGDHPAALSFFSTYLSASKTAEKSAAEADAEALLAYGKSRQAIPLPRAGHVYEAINIFQRYLQLRPGDREAQHLLLELYPKVKYNAEAIHLADTVLAGDPKDVIALRARGFAYLSQGKPEQSLAAYEQLLKAAPHHLQGHANVQTLFFQTAKRGEEKKRGDALVERYSKLRQANPDDARYDLLLARAYHYAGDEARTVQWLTAAARREVIDPEVADVLTSLLEQHDLFIESEAVLERLAAGTDDPRRVRPLVRRYWQSSRHKDVLARTEKQVPASAASDTDLLAYRALTLYDLNRTADARVIVDALALRRDDLAAVAWAQTLRARENENLAPRARALQYQEALERSPNNEVIHFFLGVAYLALGESEPAIHAWEDAARLSRSWSAPVAAIARTLAATDRSAEALAAAEEAQRRAPRAASTATGLAVAWFAHQQQNPDPARQRQLLALVETIQKQIPREPETLHVYAALLSRGGQREKAIEVIHSALDVQPPTPRDTLLALSKVSYDEKLALEGPVLDYAERVYGLTPPVAARKAVLQAKAGKPRQGLALLEDARKLDAKSDPIHWSLVLLQYRESIGDDVVGDWVRLGDANPDNALVQSAVLRTPARTRDKAFWHRTIDRMRRLAGEEAITPRVERAYWLLDGEPSEKDVSEAIVLLGAIDARSLPEIHRLLGIAHEKSAAHKTGAQRHQLLQTAAEQLRKALGDRNADAAVASDLTRVYRAMGDHAAADRVMSGLAERAAHLGIDGRRKTARTLIEQGQLEMAIAVLEPVGDGHDVTRDALLCGLYRRTGQNEKAAALYARLLDDERTEPATIADGADFFAARKDAKQAAKFIEKLKSMDVPPTTRELLLARHADRHGAPDEALKRLEAAVAADPSYPAAWEGLVGFHVGRLDFAQAVAAADRGLKVLPDDPRLRSLRAQAVALEGYRRDPDLEQFTRELSNDPQSAAVIDTVRILSEARRTKEPHAATLSKLRELADRNPDTLRLQVLVVEGHLRLGQYDEAERVALRTAARMPNDVDAARLLTSTYTARPGVEKWPRVLEAARQWRQRSLDAPLAADVTIARTLLELRRPAEAAAQLKPHVPAGPLSAEQANANVLELYAHALIRSDDEKRASDLLAPLTKTSAKWRTVWLRLAPVAFDDDTRAMKWIDQVASLIGADVGEQVALAEAWTLVGARLASTAALEKSKPVIERLTADPKSASQGWQLLAVWAEASGDMEQAIRANRKLLEAHPDNPDLQNNLAYSLLMLGRGEDLPEARRLIDAALAKQPASSTYLDTLARIHVKRGDLPAAEQAFQSALNAHQGSIEALIGLADVHARAGRADKARELLVRINNALPTGATLPPPLQRQLDGVRQSVKPPVQSGRVD